MNKPKVLIHVVGGIAYWTSTGEVEVAIVDEDNIKAGDAPVQLSSDWKALASSSFDLASERFVRII